jgi:hypothetical protein
MLATARGGGSGCIPVISAAEYAKSSGPGAQRSIADVLGSAVGRRVYVRTQGFRLYVGSGHPLRWRQARAIVPRGLRGVSAGRGHDIVYAGFRGLYRSSNAGTSWEQLGCGRIVDGATVAAHQPSLIYLAADVEDPSPHGRGGLYRSRDGGRAWDHLSISPPLDATAQAVAVNPRNADDVTVALGGGGVARTVDGGHTWSLSKMWPKPVGLAQVGLKGPQVWSLLYGRGPTLWAGSQQGAFRRDPSGEWAKVLRSGYSAEVTVVPDARLSRVAYAFGGPASPPARRTLDAGKTWRRLPGLPPDIEGITVRPSDDTAFAWTPHSIFRSSNHGSTWTQLPPLPKR